MEVTLPVHLSESGDNAAILQYVQEHLDTDQWLAKAEKVETTDYDDFVFRLLNNEFGVFEEGNNVNSSMLIDWLLAHNCEMTKGKFLMTESSQEQSSQELDTMEQKYATLNAEIKYWSVIQKDDWVGVYPEGNDLTVALKKFQEYKVWEKHSDCRPLDLAELFEGHPYHNDNDNVLEQWTRDSVSKFQNLHTKKMILDTKANHQRVAAKTTAESPTPEPEPTTD